MLNDVIRMFVCQKVGYIKTEKGGSHERPFRLNKY